MSAYRLKFPSPAPSLWRSPPTRTPDSPTLRTKHASQLKRPDEASAFSSESEDVYEDDLLLMSTASTDQWLPKRRKFSARRSIYTLSYRRTMSWSKPHFARDLPRQTRISLRTGRTPMLCGHEDVLNHELLLFLELLERLTKSMAM